jgi:hypothetical protein
MADFDQIIFGKKKFSDLIKEIYDRSVSKESQIGDLIMQLQGLIQNTSDALMVVPLIASYMDLNLKNDDLLIKMLGVVQKAMDRGKETGSTILSEEEKQQLIDIAKEYGGTEGQILTKKDLPNSK